MSDWGIGGRADASAAVVELDDRLRGYRKTAPVRVVRVEAGWISRRVRVVGGVVRVWGCEVVGVRVVRVVREGGGVGGGGWWVGGWAGEKVGREWEGEGGGGGWREGGG